jgi:hypothetical protein
VTLVADIVNRHHDGRRRPERRCVGGGVNQVDTSPCCRARKADEVPAGIGRRVRRLVDVGDAMGNDA